MILLGLVEPVHLIQEQNCLPLEHFQLCLGCLHDLLDLGDPARDGGHLDELDTAAGLGLGGEDVGEAGLATAGRPPHQKARHPSDVL